MMAQTTPLTALAKMVVKDMAAGRAGEGIDLALLAIDQMPDAAEQLVDLVIAEARRKKPNARLIDAFALLLGHALETLRYGVERRLPDALARADALRGTLRRLGRDGTLGPETMVTILGQFAAAKLDPGDELRNVMADVMEEAGATSGGADVGELADHLSALAEAVKDEFELFAQLQEFTAALPDDSRSLFAVASFTPGVERLREAAVGWLFDPASLVRRATARTVEQTAPRRLVSGTMLRRMIQMRNWLPEADRAALDDAIRACRQNGITVVPSKPAQVRDVFVSGWDGSGAQSVFVVAREGRKTAIASVLLKLGVGVRDAWVQHGGSRREADGMLDDIDVRIGLIPSTEDYVHKAMAHALTVNLISGVVPPFGLLDVVETTGLANIQPNAVPVEEMVASLCEAMPPEWLEPTAVARALKNSVAWDEQLPFVSSWFEDDAVVGEVLGSKRMAAPKALSAVLDGILEGRRRKWAELMAWTAFALRESDEDADWPEFALVARELLAGRALREIPAMMTIARVTAEAYAFRFRR
ncbi:hypothetical protein [Azospirillum canadense]|uniref:hypothetical protein n=1 Tax=Azospirillum canadense TaxID=403962 RepID=UPI002226C2A1|nr:hypothetical protein [Azospirillum canadense]MCW2242513.1 hypothetical protein [Azospirillum canadense]